MGELEILTVNSSDFTQVILYSSGAWCSVVVKALRY